ncbi:Hypothetical protein FKW44_012515 [Caligus rogercresseyi]|uniref:Uncharacterized protein n=1 Tax=Caligus rogercresseyi TaxID=217165 RepID=A0A7T8HJV0_CALRO|nr:Hypothetical protein FKW44_012515 [Caligus rogercresseyi]
MDAYPNIDGPRTGWWLWKHCQPISSGGSGWGDRRGTRGNRGSSSCRVAVTEVLGSGVGGACLKTKVLPRLKCPSGASIFHILTDHRMP